MSGVLDLYGVYVPTLLVLMLAAYGIKALLRQLLLRLHAYRGIWHPGLFNFGLYVSVLGLLFFLSQRVMS